MILTAGYFIGIFIGASNYHFIYFLVFCVIFLFFFLITNYKRFWEFLKINYLAISGGVFVVCLLSLPLVAANMDKSSVFPVSRVFGVRDLLDQMLQSGMFYQPFGRTFNSTSVYAAYTKIPLHAMLNDLLKLFFNSRADEILFFLCGVIIARFRYKFHLILTIIILCFFAAPGNIPIYSFFYEYFPILRMVRQVGGYTLIFATLKLIFIGYGIFAFLEINQGEKWWGKWYKITVISTTLVIFYYIGLLTPKYYYLLPLPLFFFPFDGIKRLFSQLQFCNPITPEQIRRALLFVLLLISGIGHYEGGFIRFTNASLRVDTENSLNPIYNNDFRPKPIVYNPSRILCLPRPGYILLEPFITKTTTALTTILEPPEGKTPADIPYLKLCKDSVVGPREIYWPKDYAYIYLLGEKNINPFIDIMGVNLNNIRFYSYDNIVRLDRQSVIKFFDSYYNNTQPAKTRITESVLFLEDNSKSYTQNDLKAIVEEKINNSQKNSFTYEVIGFNTNYIKIKVNTLADGFLLYNDMYDKYWKSYVEGKEQKILRANTAFKAIEIRKGNSVVEFRYNPVFFNVAVKVYVLINIIFLCFFIFIAFSKKPLVSNVA